MYFFFTTVSMSESTCFRTDLLERTSLSLVSFRIAGQSTTLNGWFFTTRHEIHSAISFSASLRRSRIDITNANGCLRYVAVFVPHQHVQHISIYNPYRHTTINAIINSSIHHSYYSVAHTYGSAIQYHCWMRRSSSNGFTASSNCMLPNELCESSESEHRVITNHSTTRHVYELYSDLPWIPGKNMTWCSFQNSISDKASCIGRANREQDLQAQSIHAWCIECW